MRNIVGADEQNDRLGREWTKLAFAQEPEDVVGLCSRNGEVYRLSLRELATDIRGHPRQHRITQQNQIGLLPLLPLQFGRPLRDPCVYRFGRTG